MFKKKNDIDKDGINEIIYLTKNILKLLFIILIIGILLTGITLLREAGILSFLGSVLSVLSPLFIGFVIAWLFSPLVDRLTKKGMSRILASIIIYVVFIVFLVLFFRILIPILYTELNELISMLPSILGKVTEFITDIFNKIEIDWLDLDSIEDTVLSGITTYTNDFIGNFPSMIVSLVTSLFSGIGTVVFGLVIGLYMLFDFNNITKFLIKLLPDKYEDDTTKLLSSIGFEVRKCVNGTILVACMVFICDTVGFSIIGLKSALLFGLFCGITDLIPYIGPYLGTAVATVVGLTQGTWIGIGVLIVAVIVQLVESYILQPVVMSKATNLNPVTIICGLLVFGHFFGIVGMILASPILSLIKAIWKFIVEKFNLFQEKEEISVD